ncbi:hypothetical protein [Kamptonema formosum]|uniref:hypothetical protein n=1 Tax=Kamptonema formosum TaxID=331992 RepID=UPI0012DCFE56|nr:hypothetical protein [Oscillatoria sp. PCC 10802]
MTTPPAKKISGQLSRCASRRALASLNPSQGHRRCRCGVLLRNVVLPCGWLDGSKISPSRGSTGINAGGSCERESPTRD